MIYNIRSYHGGVGDELQFSTLPEALYQLGHEVYMLKNSKEVLPFRNQGIKDLIYGEHNIYIHGEAEGNWNIGDLPTVKYENKTNDFIKNWEIAFGVDSGEKSTLPKIYYEPKKVENIQGLFELSAISFKYDIDAVIKRVNELTKERKIEFKQVVSKYQSGPIIVPGFDVVSVSDLFELSDLIYSCGSFISLSSGSHSLAAAIQRKKEFEQHCMLPKNHFFETMESRKFVYNHVIYTPV